MFKALFGRNAHARHAQQLYGAVVARSRDVNFYSSYGVPDTFDGRFEMLVMHLFLLHNRLKDEELDARKVSQRVFDAFIDDMDSALREAGVGDQTVPKRIAKMTQVFYGRTGAYEEALQSDDQIPAIAEVVARNLFPDEDANGRDTTLAGYVIGQHEDLQSKSVEEIVEQQKVYQGALPERNNDGS